MVVLNCTARQSLVVARCSFVLTADVSKTPGMIVKTSPPNREATWDFVRARTELVSWRKLYVLYSDMLCNLDKSVPK